MSKINVNDVALLYTVKLNNLSTGYIEYIDSSDLLKVGDYVENVQFIDNCGNRMGRNGYIEKIKKVRMWRNEGWSTVQYKNLFEKIEE